MPKYRATVQVSGLTGDGPRAVRTALDEQLRKSGFEKSRVVSVEIDGPTHKSPARQLIGKARAPRPSSRGLDLGGLLLIGAGAVAFWVLWSLWMGMPE